MSNKFGLSTNKLNYITTNRSALKSVGEIKVSGKKD